MSLTTRKAKVAQLLQRLENDVAPYWTAGHSTESDSIVLPAVHRLLDLLHRWQQGGDRSLLPEIDRSCHAVVEAWRTAAEKSTEPTSGVAA